MTNEQLVARIQAGEDTANSMLDLWNRNQGFIHKTALKYSGFAELEDLIQEGYIGLNEAVRHYDPAANVPFINYAAFWIRQAMRRYIDNNGSVVRIPVGARAEMAKYKKISNEYRKYYGCEPTDKEMRALLGVGVEKLENIKKSLRMGQIKSLSEPLRDDEDVAIGEMVSSDEDIEESVAELIDRQNMSRHLWLAVDDLPMAQREVILKKYKQNQTYKEIGQSMGVSLSRARDIQREGLKMLRLPRRCKGFVGYYEEYLAAAPVHHVGVKSFQRTWMSAVEREVLYHS